MHCDCHIHMALDGSDWKAALARHKTAPDEVFIRATLKNYQTLGFDFLRDGGDRWGAGEVAAKIAHLLPDAVLPDLQARPLRQLHRLRI